MPDAGSSYLRIYCLCGQKMKVSERMSGMPGKCVACRLKIRIPRRDELPEGATEVYLKDHPEWVRKRPHHPAGALKVRRKSRPVRPRPQPENEIVLGDDSQTPPPDEHDAYPVDTIEALRTLCSLQYKVEQELAAQDNLLLEESQREAETQVHELLRYQARIRRARSDLDEQLRQRLMETAIELASTQEKIGETALGVRVGEIAFPAYRERIAKLRSHREQLERRQQNLRGWLAVTDPAFAGGFVDLPFDAIPPEGATFAIPSLPENGPPLLNALVDALRDALNRRELAERGLAKTAGLEQDGTLSGKRLASRRSQYQAEKTLADSAVRFFRERLGHLKSDCRRDIEAVDSQMDLVRGRAKLGELTRAQADGKERELLRAKADYAKALDLTQRALSANAAQDVPHPQGTFLARMAKGQSDGKMPPDVWLAWGAALVMALSLFLPIAGGASILGIYRDAAFRSGGAQWALLLPVLAGVMAALAATVPDRRFRGLVMLALWATVTLSGVLFLHELGYSPSAFAERVREAGPWPKQPAVVVFVLGDLLFLAAALVALRQWNKRWTALAVAAAVVITGSAILLTDLAGWRREIPFLTVNPAVSDGQDHIVTLGNRGHRSLYLISFIRQSKAPLHNGYYLVLERKIGQESWREVLSYQNPQENQAPGDAYEQIALRVRPGETHNFTARLEPGEYRAALRNPAASGELLHLFTVPDVQPAPIAGEGQQAPSGEASTAAPPQNTNPSPSNTALPPPSGMEVELRGIVTGDEREPLFSISLHLASGETTQQQLTLEDTLYGQWVLREYNPQRQTVTLSDGSRIVTVRRGQRVALP